MLVCVCMCVCLSESACIEGKMRDCETEEEREATTGMIACKIIRRNGEDCVYL